MHTTSKQRELIVGLHFMEHLRAVEQTDAHESLVVALSQNVARELTEVWLMPEHESYLSERFLAKACFNSVDDILRYYRSPEENRGHVLSVMEKIVRGFFLALPFPDARWHIEKKQVPSGHVLKVVVGHHTMVRRAHAEGLIPWIDGR